MAHGANMRPTWVLLAPDGPHVGPMNLAIRDMLLCYSTMDHSHIVVLNWVRASLEYFLVKCYSTICSSGSISWCKQSFWGRTTHVWACDITMTSHELHGGWTHRELDCLFNSLFISTSKETSRLVITFPLWGNPQRSQWKFPSKRTSMKGSVSMSWRDCKLDPSELILVKRTNDEMKYKNSISANCLWIVVYKMSALSCLSTITTIEARLGPDHIGLWNIYYREFVSVILIQIYIGVLSSLSSFGMPIRETWNGRWIALKWNRFVPVQYSQ